MTMTDLDQTIRLVNYNARRQKNFFWWFISYCLVQKELTCKILPKQEELKSLHKLLINGEAR